MYGGKSRTMNVYAFTYAYIHDGDIDEENATETDTVADTVLILVLTLIFPNELRPHTVICTGSARHFAGAGINSMQHGTELRQRHR